MRIYRTNGITTTQVRSAKGMIKPPFNTMASRTQSPTPETERITTDQIYQSIEVSEHEKIAWNNEKFQLISSRRLSIA